jgi:hypothetical protein
MYKQKSKNFYQQNLISALPFSRSGTFDRVFHNDNSLISLIKKTRWSHGIYYHDMTKDKKRYKKIGHRCTFNFSQSALVVAEVDEDWNLSEALEYFKDYKYIIYTTKSHQKEKNGCIFDRFRIILFLDEKVYTSLNYVRTWDSIFSKLPVDKSSRDAARYWEPAEGDIYTNKGKTVKPIIVKNRNYTTPEPRLLFQDKRSAFKVNRKLAISDELISKFGKMNKDLVYEFCQTLLSLSTLKTGFYIPVNNLAETLQCSQMQASRLLKKAVVAGILQITEDTPIYGIKSKKYKSNNILYILNSKNYETKTKSIDITNTSYRSIYYGGVTKYNLGRIYPGDTIKTGNANNTFLYIVNKTEGDIENYLDYVYSLSGIFHKDREKQALRVLECYLYRKNRKPKSKYQN